MRDSILLVAAPGDLFRALVIWYTEHAWFAIPPATALGAHRRLDGFQ
jgi:hypothetical protein